MRLCIGSWKECVYCGLFLSHHHCGSGVGEIGEIGERS